MFIVYLILFGGPFAATLQPPSVFVHIMSKLPAFSSFVLPFERMWVCGRRDSLRVSDQASDLSLKTSDRGTPTFGKTQPALAPRLIQSG